MDFPNQIHDENGAAGWKKATPVGKVTIKDGWFATMWHEGINVFDLGMSRGRMEMVLESSRAPKRLISPFADWSPVDHVAVDGEDASAVRSWKGANPRRVSSALNLPCSKHAASKFRFFRRMHLCMEAAANACEAFSRSREIAGRCGYCEAEPCSFEDFVNSPEDYTAEAFGRALNAEREETAACAAMGQDRNGDPLPEEHCYDDSDEEEDDD